MLQIHFRFKAKNGENSKNLSPIRPRKTKGHITAKMPLSPLERFSRVPGRPGVRTLRINNCYQQSRTKFHYSAIFEQFQNNQEIFLFFHKKHDGPILSSLSAVIINLVVRILINNWYNNSFSLHSVIKIIIFNILC